MTPSILFITGTDTGVGKTVVAGLLTRYLADRGIRVAGLKPVCSGNRNDARQLRAAAHRALSLDEVNPWHFQAPLAPLIAARREGRRLKLAQVVNHVSRVQRRFEVVVVEGAGGLLTPLGEDFDSRGLILRLNAMPVIVCLNKLGMINQSLLTLAALPARFSRFARIVLVSPAPDLPACRSNGRFLAERIGPERVCVLPWLKQPGDPGHALRDRRVLRFMHVLLPRAKP